MNKAWQLIDVEPVEHVIEGRKVLIKQLTNGQKLDMVRRIQALSETTSDYDELMRIVATAVVSIEDCADVAMTLVNLKNIKVQAAIQRAVLQMVNGLTEEEEKN